MNHKLGFYTVDNLHFDSKINACIYAQSKNAEVKWHFNEHVFDNYMWAVEPSETLDQLYDKRAIQLRETYDYLILSYSGGADSHNILESFARQGLVIDEILVNTMEKLNKKYTIIDPKNIDPENASAEHYLQTLPRLKEFKNKSPATKITILDLSDNLLDSWLHSNDESWILNKKEGLNPLNVTRFNYIYFDDIKKKFDKEKSIGLIFGVEKPRTFIYKDGMFYLKFIDRSANIVSMEHYITDYDNTTVEYFYWSPEGADIICKQAHVIKRWLENNPEKQPYWYYSNMTADLYRKIHERELRSVIYSTWSNTYWQADKATLDWFSEFDSWWIQNFKGSKQHDIWLQGLDYVRNHARKFVRNDKGFDDGLVTFSKNYPVAFMNSEINPAQLEWRK